MKNCPKKLKSLKERGRYRESEGMMEQKEVIRDIPEYVKTTFEIQNTLLI